LEEDIAALRQQQQKHSSNPSLSLSLPATLDLLKSRQSESDDLDRQINALRQKLPTRTRELDRLRNELKPLEAQRANAILAAKEAMGRKEAGERGTGDELELKGRWYRGVEAGLRDMLRVEG
jgi:septal ring factor EnvC (AmiA/AmiB activator)